MLHEPATPQGKDAAASYKAKLGIKLFLFYTLLYAGFVVINLIVPQMMGRPVLMGLNLATVYGIGLILGAFLLALVYDFMCSKHEAHLQREEEGKG